MDLSGYSTGGFHDEMFTAEGTPRAGCELLAARLAALPAEEIVRRQHAADKAMLMLGITFNVYGHDAGTEKIFPFDVVPRIVAGAEWERIEKGLEQRITALNLFVADLYGPQKILKDGVVPRDLVESGKGFLPQLMGLKPPQGVWVHVTGTDLVRDASGAFHVLEDNLRCPSGVSYVLENRAIMKRTFPQVFEASRVRPVDEYPDRLRETLEKVAPQIPKADTLGVALLTPGIYNSAYFEHSFLAQQMGIPLVEGSDLVVDDARVYMKTTRGLVPVHVIYRRIDDTFLDPRVFRPDSLLGVPGIVEAWAKGNVALCNAPGTGIADDKVVYAYVPQVVKYYLGEEMILPNVPTYVCREPEQCAYVLEHLDELVVKAANESGGYGMLIGPAASKEERERFAEKIRATPRDYIAQPTLALSRVPTLVPVESASSPGTAAAEGSQSQSQSQSQGPDARRSAPPPAPGAVTLEGRHVDLRPYVLYGGGKPWVLPGGLTRVALRKGSLVVNSSQGGGSKDTWVLAK